MDLKEYFSTGERSIKEVAALIGLRNDTQLRHWIHGYKKRRPGAAYAIAIEKATNGKVRCEDLNDKVDWAYLRTSELTKSS